MNDSIYILVAVIPIILLVLLIVYRVVIKSISTPKVVTTRTPLNLVGISTKSTDANIERDDALLWEEFKKIRVKNGIKKTEKTFVVRVHRKNGEEQYKYFIGIAGGPNNIPEGFEYLEIPPQTYVESKHLFKKGLSWLKSSTKIKFYIYEKWLPDSLYEFNRDQDIKAIEIHNTSNKTGKRYTEIFVAVKKKAHN